MKIETTCQVRPQMCSYFLKYWVEIKGRRIPILMNSGSSHSLLLVFFLQKLRLKLHKNK